jgi:hypothetical protein
MRLNPSFPFQHGSAIDPNPASYLDVVRKHVIPELWRLMTSLNEALSANETPPEQLQPVLQNVRADVAQPMICVPDME